jgi:hypothetical protein
MGNDLLRIRSTWALFSASWQGSEKLSTPYRNLRLLACCDLVKISPAQTLVPVAFLFRFTFICFPKFMGA